MLLEPEEYEKFKAEIEKDRKRIEAEIPAYFEGLDFKKETTPKGFEVNRSKDCSLYRLDFRQTCIAIEACDAHEEVDLYHLEDADIFKRNGWEDEKLEEIREQLREFSAWE